MACTPSLAVSVAHSSAYAIMAGAIAPAVLLLQPPLLMAATVSIAKVGHWKSVCVRWTAEHCIRWISVLIEPLHCSQWSSVLIDDYILTIIYSIYIYIYLRLFLSSRWVESNTKLLLSLSITTCNGGSSIYPLLYRVSLRSVNNTWPFPTPKFKASFPTSFFAGKYFWLPTGVNLLRSCNQS